MENYNKTRNLFVIDTISSFIKEYDGIERGKRKGVKIALSVPNRKHIIDALKDKLAIFEPEFSGHTEVNFPGESALYIYNNDKFIDYSRGLSLDVVIVHDADYSKFAHAGYLMLSEDSLKKFIAV